MTYRSPVWPVLLLAHACAQAPVVQHEAPLPAPDYTAAELADLAMSDEVKRNLEPFGASPAPGETRYVTMSDGVRIAVELHYPDDLEAEGKRAPAVYDETWYTRSTEARATAIALYKRAGYVVAIADPRGFAASFGAQPSYLSELQRNDQREMLAWIAAQPWSNGQVASIGASVSGMLAEAMLASGAPSLQAGVVRATEFDQYSQNVFPGGIANPRIHELIAFVLEHMRGEPCLQDASNCAMYGPISADRDFELLRAALRDHQDNVAPESLQGVQFIDDIVGQGDFSAVSPMGRRRELEQHAVPARVSASWLDGATAQGALQRYQELPNVPMELSLSPTTHLAGLNADPFEREAFQTVQPAAEEDFAKDVAFVTRALAHEPIARKIDYYVLGANTWRSTVEWPPRGVEPLTLHLSQEGLEPHSPREQGERTYRVDPTASTGIYNRWASGTNGPIYYGDRRHAPGVRASFDAAPVPRAVELVGAPELCLAMRSDQTDGAVFAYLEDVAPDGRVTYLSEGLLRLTHRKTQHQGGACDAAPGTERSFKRADAAPVVAHEMMHVEIPFLPVAARIERDHHVRLSLAGADSDSFAPLTDTPATWQIAYGGTHGSTLRIPVRPWK